MPPANPLQTMFGDLFFAGMRVFESPLLEAKPKLKLSPSCPVSDEFPELCSNRTSNEINGLSAPWGLHSLNSTSRYIAQAMRAPPAWRL